MIFKLIMFPLSASIPGFQYFCVDGKYCWGKEKLLFGTFEEGRTQCKFCRFRRCRELAGMVDKWVISAYKPLGENNRMNEVSTMRAVPFLEKNL